MTHRVERGFALIHHVSAAAGIAALLAALGCGGGGGVRGDPPAVPTFTISGSVTGVVGAEVTVALTGAASATVTTDSSGAFAFHDLASGSYTVVPSAAGYAFSPGSAPVSVAGASVGGIDFTATAVVTCSETVHGNGTTTVACSDGRVELTCTNPDCSGIPAVLELFEPSLTHVSLPTLFTLDDLVLSRLPALVGVSLPALATAGRLVVSELPSLTSLHLPALTTAGRLVAMELPSLTSLQLPALSTVGFLTLRTNAGLASVDLPSLTSMSELAEVVFNPELTSLHLPALTSLWYLRVQGNQALAQLSLPALTWVEQGLQLMTNPALAALELPELYTGTLWIDDQGAGALISLELPALTVGTINVTPAGATALTSLKLPALTFGGVSIGGAPALTSLDLPVLAEGSVGVSGTALTTVNLPSLTTPLSDLWFQLNGALATLSLPRLASLTYPYRLVVMDNASLTALEVPSLTDGLLLISGNGLPTLSLPALTSSSTIFIAGNPAMTSVSAPELTTVGTTLSVSDNPSLMSMSLPKLTTVGYSLAIVGNTVYPQCAAEAILGRLVGFTGTATFSGNDGAAVCLP